MKKETEDYLRDRIQQLKRLIETDDATFEFEWYAELIALQRILVMEFGEDDLDAR